TLGWTAGSSEENWQVIVLPAGSPAPTADSTGWIDATTNPIVADNLTFGTSYEYYVRAVCDEEDSSTWAGPFAFNTTICPPADQCLYTFTMVDAFGDGWNGNTISIVQNNVVVGILTGPTIQQNTSPVSVQIPLCNGIAFDIIWN